MFDVQNLVAFIVLSHFLTVLIAGGCIFFGVNLGERAVLRWAMTTASSHVLLKAVLFLLCWQGGLWGQVFDLGSWLHIPGYSLDFRFALDLPGTSFLLLSSFILLVITRFSLPSFVKDPGRDRFFFVLSLLGFGVTLISLSGNLDVHCIGWELTGLASVFLISFFRHNPRAVENSFRALIYYRMGDVGMLAATAVSHHHGSAHWLGASLLVFGTLAKSAQLPFSPWLPRAVEGPTASSAAFYGGIAIHLGVITLLRRPEIWMDVSALRIAMGILGLATLLFAVSVGRSRPDAKTHLAYASMAGVSLLYIELSLGWLNIALVHLCLHAFFRTWQFLRASSLLQDFQENPVAYDWLKSRTEREPIRSAWRRKFLIWSVHGFFVDAIQIRLTSRILNFFLTIVRWEESISSELSFRMRGKR